MSREQITRKRTNVYREKHVRPSIKWFLLVVPRKNLLWGPGQGWGWGMEPQIQYQLLCSYRGRSSCLGLRSKDPLGSWRTWWYPNEKFHVKGLKLLGSLLLSLFPTPSLDLLRLGFILLFDLLESGTLEYKADVTCLLFPHHLPILIWS